VECIEGKTILCINYKIYCKLEHKIAFSSFFFKKYMYGKYVNSTKLPNCEVNNEWLERS